MIASVIDPTDWVHLLVVVPKTNSGIRLSFDFQKLHQHIRRLCYPTKNHHRQYQTFKHSKYFTTFDAKTCHW